MTAISITSDEHWHALRRQYVGGSEVAALFDACSYLTKLELWLIKRGEISGAIDDNERMFWGRHIEESVAQGLAAKRKWRIENPKCYLVCDDTSGMGCTPDRYIYDVDGKPGAGLLQIKNVDWLEFKKWENGEPPLMYQLQLQHELACAGFKWGALAVLVGGNDLKIYEYDAHDGAIAKIKSAIRDFWKSVEENKSPPAVADDYETLKEISGGIDEEIDLSQDNELPMLCAQANAAAATRLAAEKEEKTNKVAILERLAGYARAHCAGFTIKITTVNRKSYTVAETSYQQLRIKESV